MASGDPRRGEIWLVSLGAARSGEPGKTRPAVVVSADQLLTGSPGELVIVVPLSSSRAPSALRPEVGPETGIDRPSRAICRGVRAVARTRLARKLGAVSPEALGQIDDALVMVLDLKDRVVNVPT